MSEHSLSTFSARCVVCRGVVTIFTGVMDGSLVSWCKFIGEFKSVKGRGLLLEEWTVIMNARGLILSTFVVSADLFTECHSPVPVCWPLSVPRVEAASSSLCCCFGQLLVVRILGWYSTLFINCLVLLDVMQRGR